jgi:hypothetical protein
VAGASNAVLENVNIYSLSLEDLHPLQTSDRLSPWIPRGLKARKEEDKMSLGGGPQDAIERRRAHFWMRLSDILKTSHASGIAQSEARYAAARARRVSAPTWSREKLLLSLYWPFGYGERVLRPLLWPLVASLALTAWFVWPVWPLEVLVDKRAVVADTWWHVLLRPLAFFRLWEPSEEVSGLGYQLTLAAYSVLGIISVFFSLIALRRIAKAE